MNEGRNQYRWQSAFESPFSRRNELKFQGTLLALWQGESQSRAALPEPMANIINVIPIGTDSLCTVYVLS